jgi:hypothetical protein
MNGIEFRPFALDDFSASPACFQKDFDKPVRLFRHDYCAMLPGPAYIFHNFDETQSRWAGMIDLGEGVFSLQKSKGVLMNQTGKTTPFALECDDSFGMRSVEGIPFSFWTGPDGCRILEGEEGSILDVKGTWFENGLICHPDSEYGIPFMHLPALFEGTCLGKPVQFLGCIDRIFAPAGMEKSVLASATRYVSSYCSGILPDGRKEWFMGLLCHDNGKGLGIYWRQGEPAIITDNVFLEGQWERLPYVNDGTVLCPDAIWHLDDLEVHVHGKWGSKGFTDTPRLDRHGQSQMFGSWHAGKSEYKHILSNTFNENMEVYAQDMTRRGFQMKGETK